MISLKNYSSISIKITNVGAYFYFLPEKNMCLSTQSIDASIFAERYPFFSILVVDQVDFQLFTASKSGATIFKNVKYC